MELRTSQDELNKLPDFPTNDLQELRDFIKSNPELPNISDKRLIQFHFSCFYSLEDTKKCIKTYYECFKNYSEFFANRSLSDPGIRNTVPLVAQYIVPVRTSDDSQIILAALVNSDASNYSLESALKYFIMAIEAAVHIYGVSKHTEVVIDYKNTTFRHFLKINIGSVKKMIKVYEEALPIRAKAIHLVNVNFYVSKIVGLAKPFVSKELFEKIKFYTEDQLSELHENVPPEFLSEEHGGTLGPVSSLIDKFETSLRVAEPYFNEEEKLVAKTD